MKYVKMLYAVSASGGWAATKLLEAQKWYIAAFVQLSPTFTKKSVRLTLQKTLTKNFRWSENLIWARHNAEKDFSCSDQIQVIGRCNLVVADVWIRRLQQLKCPA
ncbi:hypothetical protein HI914_03221 [Erysiphe necator]|nr:hypothetical protein HI914_03221 [Erysiphe necator]